MSELLSKLIVAVLYGAATVVLWLAQLVNALADRLERAAG
jgi:hypothetical protein